MQDDFVNLHTHTDASAFDGLGKVEEFVEKAARLGQPAIAFTEHGTMRSLYAAAKSAEKNGIKLIPGCEMYLADDAKKQGLTDDEKAEIVRRFPEKAAQKEAKREAERVRRERDHITVWATNAAGLRNLYRLTSWSWRDGFYFKPRIDLDVLAEHAEGLAVSTGCPGGVISSPLRSGKNATAIERMTKLAETFGDRLLVEIMPHIADASMVGLASKLVRLSDSFGASFVATQDAHYPEKGDAAPQESLLCIHTRSTMSAPDRFVFDARDYWLKSRDEMREAFAKNIPTLPTRIVERALDGSVEFAERCSAKVATSMPGAYLVSPPRPGEFANDREWLRALVVEGCDRLEGKLDARYIARLKHELATIFALNFERYFLAVADVRAWARREGIFCGPGRGSAAGSLVCYVLGITDIDPIRFDLSFERFLAPGRIDLPDIDADFESDRREDVIDYLREAYGADCVSRIATHNTLGGKRAIRDLGRIFEIPEAEVAAVAATIETNPDADEEGDGDSLSRALKTTATGRAFADRYPDVASVAARLEGQIRDIGIHAAGVVMSSVRLDEIVPLESRPRTDGHGRVAVTAYEMIGVEGSGLVKLDVLGLRTLTTLKKAFALSGSSPNDIDFEDVDTLACFTRNDLAGVFQFDTPSARRICAGHDFATFADVAVITALNRPGPMKSGLVEKFLERAKDPTSVVAVHPIYDRVFAETFGVPIYQEQVVALVKDLCGYDDESADKFRKKVSKKLGLSDEQERFVEGAIARGMPEERAEKLFADLTGFAQYGFNKAHSYSYAAIAFWCAWLKTHHPSAFFAAALDTEPRQDGRLRLAAEARKRGIEIVAPDVNVKHHGFSLREVDGKSQIVGSLADVKGVGDKAARQVIDGAPYDDLGDFIERVRKSGRSFTVRAFDALAQVSAFRSLHVNSRVVAVNAPLVWEAYRKGARIVIAPEIRDFEPAEFLKRASVVWPLIADAKGLTDFDARLKEIREASAFDVLTPGDHDLIRPGVRVALVRTSKLKVFAGKRGEAKTGRASLCSGDGNVVETRVDAELLAEFGDVLKKENTLGLALVSATERGACSLEHFWPICEGAALSFETGDLKPRDLAKTISRLEEGQSTLVDALVVRVRTHVDRSGGKMATITLASGRSFAKALCFASRLSKRDARLFEPGARLTMRLKKLDGEACCVADVPVTISGEKRAGS
jgi:DNA polymerase-3 subunit alpha